MAEKIVVITGAGSGMGRDAALYLNSHDYTVFAGVRGATDGDELIESVDRPDALLPIQLDVTSDTQVADAVVAVKERIRVGAKLVGLFSNAGIAAFDDDVSSEGMSMERLERILEVDFFGGVRFIRGFLPILRASRGTVVINSALMAQTILPFNGGYAAAKCALEGWADSLRREIAPLGVRVVLIEAAAVATDLGAKQSPEAIPIDTPYRTMAPMVKFFLEKQAEVNSKPGASPRRVSEIVKHALEARRPKTRYTVGLGARSVSLLGRLPDKVQDKIMIAWLERIASKAP